jgi:formate hydrogenlyase transcriptional activator
VLILGETGVGKEMVARAIHQNSDRKDKAFIRVNCSVFPETLIASELFGNEKGAFTGADSKKIGRFELADQGTIFLDEIGDISMEVQVRLLRVLQTKEFERVGGRETVRSDFRLILATHKDLQKEIKAGRFRQDLYYRINVFPILVPPLRDRKDDIPLLVKHFLDIHHEDGRRKMVSNEDLAKLLTYHWPGNVRELENIIERGVILSRGSRFKMPNLHENLPEKRSDLSAVTHQENECRHILNALKTTGGKISGNGGAAELLDIHPNTLYYRIKKLGINRKLDNHPPVGQNRPRT